MPGINHQGDNLEEIYAWIDEVPFSRPKKNIPRDFSDGVLMAEVLKAHYPRYVDVHNYIPANNVAAKKENWTTLNRKVFSKIDMKLSKEVVNQLANAQPGVIEKVLMDLKRKILINGSSISEESNSLKIEYDENFDKEETQNEAISDRIIENDEKVDEKNGSSQASDNTVIKIRNSDVSVTKDSENLIGKACGWIAGWIWPSSKSLDNEKQELPPSSIYGDRKLPEKEDVKTVEESVSIKITEDDENNDQESSISRSDFLQLRKEVDEKNLAICMLNRKVSCLESLMKSKDKKIGNLAARISSTSGAAAQNQNFRPHVMGSSISRLRTPAQLKNYNHQIT